MKIYVVTKNNYPVKGFYYKIKAEEYCANKIEEDKTKHNGARRNLYFMDELEVD